MSTHLGRALTAYVDGELDVARREEVQVHLAHCAQCRQDLAALRLVKGVLRRESGPLPCPDDLAARVLAATTMRSQPALVPRAQPPRRRPVADRGPLRRTALSAGALAIGAGTAFALAGPPPQAPVAPVDPASAGLVISHVTTANEVPFAGPAVVPVSAPAPDR